MSLNENYVLVSWPECQEFMEKEWFQSEAILGPDSSYFIPKSRVIDIKSKEEFINIISLHKQAADNLHKYYDLGIDLCEGKYSVVNNLYDCINKLFKQLYTKIGIDWIEWFIYENDYGLNKYEAYDDDKLICQTVEDLYDYIQQYIK